MRWAFFAYTRAVRFGEQTCEALACARTHARARVRDADKTLRAALRQNVAAFYGLSMHSEVHERNSKCIISRIYHQINRIEYADERKVAFIQLWLLSSRIDDWKRLYRFEKWLLATQFT